MTEANGKAHGKLTLRQAMAESCNVAFGSLALSLGRDGMRQALEHQGFFRPLGSFFEENAPRTPNFSELTPGELAQTGIGQGDLVVTPLRMAMLGRCATVTRACCHSRGCCRRLLRETVYPCLSLRIRYG